MVAVLTACSAAGCAVGCAVGGVASQGSANVSHGCLNISPANARWYYGIMQRGDVIKLTGTDRQIEWNNGWGYWQLPFDTWREGSALRRPATGRAPPYNALISGTSKNPGTWHDRAFLSLMSPW